MSLLEFIIDINALMLKPFKTFTKVIDMDMKNLERSLEFPSVSRISENNLALTRATSLESIWRRFSHAITRPCLINRYPDRRCDIENGISKLHEENETKQNENSTLSPTKKSDSKKGTEKTCMICFTKIAGNTFFQLENCGHEFCTMCLITYLKIEILESRTDIACPQCPVHIHPNNIASLLRDYPDFQNKYEEFMIRRYLVSDPDSRWCPGVDCSYAVIASGCASCPELKCERLNCGISFCYHCKAVWHPDQTCDAARTRRSRNIPTSMRRSGSSICDDIKPCPRCQVLIVKMNDGSCNHMICAVCGSEFCWLCMKEVSDLHYLSPSGCTFWGKKPWSRKKKIVWQIGTLIGAPVGIALLAGIAVPSMVLGIPVWVGRKLFERYKMKSKLERNVSITIGVTVSILISPLLAALAIAVGIPILLFYVYGIVPISLCRTGCRESTKNNLIITQYEKTAPNDSDAVIDVLSYMENKQ